MAPVNPHRPVYITRWKVVAAFVTLCLIAVGTAKYNDHRIDQATMRIRANTARTEDLVAVNHRQDELRRQLLRGLLHADEVACLRIEQLKTQNRLEAQRGFRQLHRNLAILGVPLTPRVVLIAKKELRHTLRLNRPSEC